MWFQILWYVFWISIVLFRVTPAIFLIDKEYSEVFVFVIGKPAENIVIQLNSLLLLGIFQQNSQIGLVLVEVNSLFSQWQLVNSFNVGIDLLNVIQFSEDHVTGDLKSTSNDGTALTISTHRQIHIVILFIVKL